MECGVKIRYKVETDRNQVVLAAPGALGKLRRMSLSSNYPSHDPDPGVAPSVTILATLRHEAPRDNAMLGSRNGFSLTLSGLSFSHRIVIDVRLNGSDDPDDSTELRNPIVVETKINDIVFVCISLVHLFEIHHHEMR